MRQIVDIRARGIVIAPDPRGERVAKYNRLLRIEEELGAEAPCAGCRPFGIVEAGCA